MPDHRPFDAQKELRHQGRVEALKILLSCAERTGAAVSRPLAAVALGRIGHRVATWQASAECPEALLEGIHDIERALREAIDSPSG